MQVFNRGKSTPENEKLMMKKRYLLLSILYIPTHFFAQNKTVYFDSDWKETQKSNAKYYRRLPLLKLGNMELIQDHYVKGDSPQMQGYFVTGDEKNKVGDVFWFYQDQTDASGTSYINKTAQKKLTYYFDDGKVWKTIQYGDSLKVGKTIEYKPDGSILGEAIYKDGYIQSGVVGTLFSRNGYRSYNKKTQSDDMVQLPEKEEKNSEYKQIYYWKHNLKTAVEYSYRNGKCILEMNFDKDGNLVQKLDSTSYYISSKNLKNGKSFYYRTQKSGVVDEPLYREYKSFPFSNVTMENVSHIILHRGTVNFIEKHPTKDVYREIEYRFFTENGLQTMRLERDFQNEKAWKPMQEYKNTETSIVSVSEIEPLSIEKIFQKFGKRKWINPYFKNKPFTEYIYFSSPEFMGKTIQNSSSGKIQTNDKESVLIYVSLIPGKYMILRENGGYFIPKTTGDLIEIPNYVQE